MNFNSKLFTPSLSRLSYKVYFLPVLIFLAASLNCRISAPHQTDGQMIDFFNQNEAAFSRLAAMAQEDRKLWRITSGGALSSNRFEIYAENDFRHATEEEINLERRNEYLELMRKTGVTALLKEDVSKNETGIFLSITTRNLAQNHRSEKGFLFTKSKLAENVFASLDDRNQNESYRPPILDFRNVKPDWFLYYRSE